MTDSVPGAATPAPRASTRRRLLFGAVGAAAGAAGIGLAWWQRRLAPALAPEQAALWQLEFLTPGGAPLAMRSFAGKPLLLNFWATWCPPCVEELPLLDRFFAENSGNGWQVLGLAIDQAAPVNSFLQRLPLRFPVALAGFAGIELSKSLGNLSGGLPFTVVLGSAGAVVHRKIGLVKEDDLQLWRTLR